MKKVTQQRLTPEQCQMILDNKGLIYHIMYTKFNISQKDFNYEDIAHRAEKGLVSAALKFDASLGYNFTTLAGKCITNEIRMYFKDYNRKDKQVISLEKIIDDNNKISIKDTIEDLSANFEEKIIIDQEFIEMMNIILNRLEPKETIIMLYWSCGSTQKEIESMMEISQSYISRIQRKALKLIRKIANENIKYRKIFRIQKMEESYYISFFKTDIGDWNTILSEILTKDLDGYRITYNNQEVLIEVAAELESFYIIAKIMEVIYKYSPEI